MHAIFLMATPSREDDSRKMLVSISPVRLVNIKLSLGLAGSRHKWDESFIKTGSKWILDIYKGWVTQFRDNKKCAVTAGTPPPPKKKKDSGLVANKLLLACVQCKDLYRTTGGALTPQEVRAGRRWTVRPKQQPIKVILLPLGEIAQIRVWILFEGAASR